HATALPEGPQRRQLAGEFLAQMAGMIDGVINEQDWTCRLTAEQINAWFAEDFGRDAKTDKVLPAGVREPRVSIDADRIRLAFRYGTEPWAAVVSIDLRLWLAPKEPNVLALELQGMRAGAVPISAQSLLESVYEAARQQNIDPSPWYRHRGNPVTLLRFQADKVTPTIRLKRLELHPGEIFISGGANTNEGVAAANP